MGNDHHPLEDRDPRQLSQREFQLLSDYRMRKLEDRVDGLFRAMWTMASALIVGVVLYFVQSRSPAAHAAFSWLGLG